MRFCIFFFFLFLFSFSFVTAIGVSPADYKVDFEPGMEKTFGYNVLNNKNHPINARIELANEEAKQYLTLSDRIIPMSALGTVSFSVNMKLPQEFERAGWHKFDVRVVEDFESENTGMVVRTASLAPIKVFVPYPGKYAEVQASATSVAAGKQSKIDVVIDNGGTESLSDTELFLSIHDMTGTVVAEWVVSDIDLASQQEREVIKYSSEDLKPGKYIVVARYEYEGKTLTKETSFKIGTQEVHPVGITDYLETNKVVQFKVNIESYWNEPISGVYAIVNIAGKEGSTSPTIIKEFKAGIVEGFIDLTGVEPQNTTAEVTVLFDTYRSPTEEYAIELYNSPDPILERPESVIHINNEVIIFTVALIVLVIAALIVVLTGRKHHGKTKEKEYNF